MYLFDEQPILANKTLAKELGLNEALVLQQINYWIEINKKSGNNYVDGKYWTYNSIRAWQEKDFDYMSIDTVKRTFAKLEKMGFLLVGNFNKDPRDKTKWYTINEERLNQLYFEIEEQKREFEERILTEAMKKDVPNALVQNAPMEKGKTHRCSSADCTTALEENLPVQYSNIPQPLPEITTKNSSKISSENSSHLSILERVDLENIKLKTEMKGGNKDIKTYKFYLEEMRNQVGYYEHLEVGNKIMASSYDEIIRVLADIMVLDEKETITVNQTKLTAKVVQERFRELQYDHIEYLVNVIRENEYKIRNIRAFILTSAYNAPSNMDAYYTALVNYDMRGGY